MKFLFSICTILILFIPFYSFTKENILYQNRIDTNIPQFDIDTVGIPQKSDFTANNKCQLDSIIYTTEGQDITHKMYFEYIKPGYISSLLLNTFNPETGQWGNYSRSTYTYNATWDTQTSITQSWDNDNELWKDGTQYIKKYDSNNNLLLYKTKWWHKYDKIWIERKRSYTYDDRNNILSYTYQIWNDEANDWFTEIEYIYSYDENDSVLTYQWNSFINNNRSSSQLTENKYDERGNKIFTHERSMNLTIGEITWQEGARTTLTYNDDNKLTSTLLEYWIKEAKKWEPYSQELFTYDKNSNKLSYCIQNWHPEYHIWIDYYQMIYTYNEYNIVDTYLGSIWDIDEKRWIDTQKITYYYNSMGKLLSQLEVIWYENQWRNNFRTTYAYGLDNSEIKTVESWEYSINEWRYQHKLIQKHDNNHCLTYWNLKTWRNGAWENNQTLTNEFTTSNIDFEINCSELYAYYSQPATRVENQNKNVNTFELAQNYPNPFNPTTTINYSIEKASHVKLGIYNTLGQLVSVLVDKHQKPGKYSVKYNANQSCSGVYYYKLETGEQKSIRKMLYLK